MPTVHMRLLTFIKQSTYSSLELKRWNKSNNFRYLWL